MKVPNLVSCGLSREFESGFYSDATRMMYANIKIDKSEIEVMIRETWEYLCTENKSTHVLSHFLYLLAVEVEREWVKDISLEIIKYGLNYDDMEVIDETIRLIEEWHDKDILDLLYNTEIKEDWLNDYKREVLKDNDYFN